MRAIHSSKRELQRWIDGYISFRNPLTGDRRCARRRPGKPCLQLTSRIPQGTPAQQRHQFQYVSPGPARKAVKDLPPHVHVKGVTPFALVDGAPSAVPVTTTSEIFDLVAS